MITVGLEDFERFREGLKEYLLNLTKTTPRKADTNKGKKVAVDWVKHPDKVDDIMQDTFLHFRTYLEKVNYEFESEKYLWNYIKVAAFRLHLSYYNLNNRTAQNDYMSNGSLSVQFDEMPLILHPKDDNIAYEILVNDIKFCMDYHMTDKQKEAFLMYLQGYKFSEIALKFGVSKQAIEQRVKSARNIVKVLIS